MSRVELELPNASFEGLLAAGKVVDGNEMLLELSIQAPQKLMDQWRYADRQSHELHLTFSVNRSTGT